MPRYEYKVVPAPTKGTKAKGVKTPHGRFANSIEGSLNMLAAEGWEYLSYHHTRAVIAVVC